MFRSYRAFVSEFYKVAIWIIYPMIACFGCIIVQTGCFGLLKRSGYHYMAVQGLLCSGIVFVECVADYWLFSGIQSKSVNHMDFLKGSRKGKLFFKNAILSDIMRRAIVILICNGFNLAIGILIFKKNLSESGGIELVILYSVCCYFFSTLGVFISRFSDIWWLNMSSGYFGSFIFSVLLYFISALESLLWIWIIAFLVFGVVISMMIERVAIKKVEDSYYDERP